MPDDNNAIPPEREGNVWAVKLRRQLGHNRGLVIWLCGIVMTELIFIIAHIRRDRGDTNIYRLPYWGVLLPMLCSFATLALEIYPFSGRISANRENGPEFRHFLELSPIAPFGALSGLLKCHAAIFGVMLLAIAPALLVVVVNFQNVHIALISTLLIAGAAPLLLVLACNAGIFRLDTLTLFAVLMFILLLTGDNDYRNCYPGILAAVVLILCVYELNAFLFSAGARRAALAMRVPELALIATAALLQWYFADTEKFPLWMLSLVAAAGSVADLGDAAGRGRGCRRGFLSPESSTSALWSVFCCGAAALVLIWFLESDKRYFFVSMLGAAALAGNLMLMRTRCGRSILRGGKFQPGVLVIFVSILMLLLIFGVFSHLDTYYRRAAAVIWGLAVLSLPPLIFVWRHRGQPNE